MNLYKDLNATKEEITYFIKIIRENLNHADEINEPDMRNIAKKIFFLKKIFNDNDNSYSDLLIYSIFQMVYNTLFENNCIEVFNLYKRIYIENLYRYLLNINDTRTPIVDMRDSLNEDINIKKYINSLYSEHRKSSGIIHVNRIESINIDSYFRDIIDSNKKIIYENYNKNTNDILSILNITTKIMLIKKFKIIGIAFYNNMNVLEYLVGKKNYRLYINTYKK